MWQAYEVIEHIRIHEMYSLFEICYQRGYAFPGESHNFWECVYVMEGSLCVSGNERVYNMEAGDLIFHKPLEMHKLWVDSGEGTRLLIFSFSMSGNLCDFFKDKMFRLTQAQRDIITRFASFLGQHDQELPCERERVPNNYLEYFHKSHTYSQLVTTYLIQLFLSLYEEGTEPFASTVPDALLFKKAVNYMNSRIHEQPGIEEIADYCHVSPTWIKKIFSKYSGLGVHKYFIKMKINAATQLLKEGCSVCRVSEQLGFASQEYFSYAFKRETGYTPTGFKRIFV